MDLQVNTYFKFYLTTTDQLGPRRYRDVLRAVEMLVRALLA